MPAMTGLTGPRTLDHNGKPTTDRLIGIACHPAGALAAGVLLAIAADSFVRSGIAASDRIAAVSFWGGL
jgi:hypothetical protein